jgi:hypothetical protein
LQNSCQTFLDCRRTAAIQESVLFVFWYHSPSFLDTPLICDISRLRVKANKPSGNVYICSDKEHPSIIIDL